MGVAASTTFSQHLTVNVQVRTYCKWPALAFQTMLSLGFIFFASKCIVLSLTLTLSDMIFWIWESIVSESSKFITCTREMIYILCQQFHSFWKHHREFWTYFCHYGCPWFLWMKEFHHEDTSPHQSSGWWQCSQWKWAAVFHISMDTLSSSHYTNQVSFFFFSHLLHSDSYFPHLWLIVLTTYSTLTHTSHTYDSAFSHLLHHDSLTPIVLLLYIQLDIHL